MISVEYKGQDYKYDLICSCGNNFQKSWRDMRRTDNLCCKECLGKIQSERMAFTYDEVKNYIEVDSNSGCKLLSEKYINAHQKLKLKCKCGNIFWRTLNDFKSGNQRQCNECVGYIKWNKELIIKYVSKYPDIELLNKHDDLQYNSLLKIRCKCGNVFERTFKDLKRYKYKLCQDCVIQKRALNIRNSYEEVKRNVESVEGYKLLSKSYEGYSKRLKIQCPDNHVFHMSYGNFYFKGCRCLVCNRKNIQIKKTKTNNQFIKEVYELIGEEYTFLEKYKGADNKIKCRHNKCGHEWQISPSNFLRGKRCPKCSRNTLKTTEKYKKNVHSLVGDEYSVLGTYVDAKTYVQMRHNYCGYKWDIIPNSFLQGTRCPQCAESKGEQRIREYLESKYINFQQEYSFDDLLGTGGGVLRFDFAVFDNDKKLIYLIEYDGEFHFKKQYDNDNFEDLRIHDKRKNQYCRENNIPLLRIPYWKFGNIEDILKEVLDESI